MGSGEQGPGKKLVPVNLHLSQKKSKSFFVAFGGFFTLFPWRSPRLCALCVKNSRPYIYILFLFVVLCFYYRK